MAITEGYRIAASVNKLSESELATLFSTLRLAIDDPSYIGVEDTKYVLVSDLFDDHEKRITDLEDDKADKSNVLALDNTTEFVPNADFEPATLKTVDLGFRNISWASDKLTASTNPPGYSIVTSILHQRICQQNGVVYISCRFKVVSASNTAGLPLMSYDNEFGAVKTRIEFGGINQSSKEGEGFQMYIDTNERIIRCQNNYVDDSLGDEYTFNIAIPLI